MIIVFSFYCVSLCIYQSSNAVDYLDRWLLALCFYLVCHKFGLAQQTIPQQSHKHPAIVINI
jgi:hypothetical protein